MGFLVPLAAALFTLPEAAAPLIGGVLDTLGLGATASAIGGEVLSPVLIGSGLGGIIGGPKGLEEGALAGLGSGVGFAAGPLLGSALGSAVGAPVGSAAAGTADAVGSILGSVGGDVLGTALQSSLLGQGNTPTAVPPNTLAPAKIGGSPLGPGVAGASGLSLSGSTAPQLFPWQGPFGSSFAGV